MMNYREYFQATYGYSLQVLITGKRESFSNENYYKSI